MITNDKDHDILARPLWGEGRGESLSGQITVAWTIRNRVSDGKAKSRWGEGYAGVCQKPYQFSCWNKNDPNFSYLSGAKPIPSRELAQARIAADQVIEGKVPDPTGGATHYYASTMPNAPTRAAKAKQTLTLGHHIFFKGLPLVRQGPDASRRRASSQVSTNELFDCSNRRCNLPAG
jgi:spore germination cell wall hydrolase CwlJ-like protein